MVHVPEGSQAFQESSAKLATRALRNFATLFPYPTGNELNILTITEIVFFFLKLSS